MRVSSGESPTGLRSRSRRRRCSPTGSLQSARLRSTTSQPDRCARPLKPRRSSSRRRMSSRPLGPRRLRPRVGADGAPALQSDYVFPVGGGPRSSPSAHTHHDYPAADIAAPEGSPLYAITNSDVVHAWPRRSALRHRPDDPGPGRSVWTYCHLAFLEPGSSRVSPSQREAGRARRLHRPCDRPASPSPAAAGDRYPQNMAWFQGFAGTAFHWQDAPTMLELPDATPAAPRACSRSSPESVP